MLKTSIMLAAIALVSCCPAYSQGFAEYGSVLGGSPRGGPGGLGKTINNLYNRGAYSQPSAARSGTRASAGPRITSDQLARYTAQANASYTAALAAQKAGHLDQAVKNFAASLSIRERVWGFTDPAVGEIARRQAEILMKQGKHAEAEAAYRKVLACESRRFGSDSPEATKVLVTLAALCDKQGKNKDALSFYRQLYGIRKNASSTSDDTRNVRLRLATLLSGAQDYNGAEKVLSEGLTAEQSAQPPDNTHLSKLYSCYADLCAAQGREADAQQWAAKAQSLATTNAPTTTPTPETPPDQPTPAPAPTPTN